MCICIYIYAHTQFTSTYSKLCITRSVFYTNNFEMMLDKSVHELDHWHLCSKPNVFKMVKPNKKLLLTAKETRRDRTGKKIKER